MHLKFCSCRLCRRGRKSKRNQAMIKQMLGGAKRSNIIILKKRDFNTIEDVLIRDISVPYTD